MSTKEIPGGKHGILVEDFEAAIKGHFSPKEVEVKFYTEEGPEDAFCEYIKVFNNDRTFQLYNDDSKPTLIELINTIFRKDESPKILGIKVEDYMYYEEIHKKRLKEIIQEYGLPKDSVPSDWYKKENEDENCKKASKEWEDFLWDKTGIFFVYE